MLVVKKKEKLDTMGEVRTIAKLSNAIDEALVRRGQIRSEQVRTYRADALVDTSALRTVLPVHVVQQLGLAITASESQNTPTGGRMPWE